MTVSAVSLEQPASASPLPGPVRARTIGEFLITGGATLLLIPLALWYRKAAGLEHSEYLVSMVAFYAAYVINDPHFAVSYLLFYKNIGARLRGEEFQGAQRIRYIVAGFVVPVLMSAWIAVALIQMSAALLGALVQLMFFLVGWHYVKQGFGVLTVLSARYGVRFSGRERFVALAHCFSAWAYAWTSPREMGGRYEESGVVYTALRHPPGLEPIALVAFALSTLALVWVVIERIRRRDPLPPVAATTGFFMALWLWTVYSSFDPLIAYVIPGLHSLQYWYFVYLLKKNEARHDDTGGKPAVTWLDRVSVMFGPLWGRLGLFFVTAVALAWLGFSGVPEFLDDNFVASTAKLGENPEISSITIGATTFVAAFATFINIHHYFMDHVIWRRENPDTRFLRN
jgi:hypothetical protein